MAPRSHSLVTTVPALRWRVATAPLVALAALVGCAQVGTPSPSKPPAAATNAVPSGPTAMTEPAPPGDMQEPPDPPTAEEMSFERCTSEERAADDRVAACLDTLDRTVGTIADETNMVSERAQSIRVLYALGHRVPMKPAIDLALRGWRRTCVVIHEQAAGAVASLMCRASLCGDGPEWHPFDLVLATDVLETQNC